jgi:translation elongation factor EF-1beta
MVTIEDKEEEIDNIQEELKKLNGIESTLDYE